MYNLLSNERFIYWQEYMHLFDDFIEQVNKLYKKIDNFNDILLGILIYYSSHEKTTEQNARWFFKINMEDKHET